MEEGDGEGTQGGGANRQVRILTPGLFYQAMEEVYQQVVVQEKDMWDKVCKGVAPMQPVEMAFGEKHFRVAKKILEICITNDRCVEFIPDMAYPCKLVVRRKGKGRGKKEKKRRVKYT